MNRKPSGPGAPPLGSVDRLVAEAEKLASRGNLEGSAQLCAEVLARVPGHAGATALMRQIRAAPPGGTRAGVDAALRHLIVLYRQRRLDAVIDRGRVLAGQAPWHPMIPNILGAAHAALGDPVAAEASFRAALALEPRLVPALSNLGAALAAQGRHEEAIASYRAALDLKPDHAEAATNLGNALYALDRFDEALKSYAEALCHAPGNPDVHDNVCLVLERTGRLEALRQAVADAESRAGDAAVVRYWRAVLDARDGRHAEARAGLAAIDPGALPPERRIEWSGLLGKTLDRLGEPEAAFGQFGEMNRLTALSPAGSRVDGRRYLRMVRDLHGGWEDAELPAFDATPGPDLAFLVGFPRSGTTLLDTVLRSHPKIAVVEEQPMMRRVLDTLGTLPTAEVVAGLDCAAVDGLRRVYFDEMARHLDRPDADVIVDKLPLNMIEAGLIHRLFPKSRFILALRHPCDCVLSCYMQNFQLNDAMACFLDLGRTAELYAAAMTLWQTYCRRLPLAVHEVRYDDLIGDFRGTVEPLLEFLGLAWDDAMQDHRATAAVRGRIRTPSYSQVTQSLYDHATGRWLRYRTQMAPVLPVLRPWIEAWGYDA